MRRISKRKAKESTGGRRWAARLTACLVAVAGLVTATALPLDGVRPPDRDKAKVAEVASADYAAAPDLAAADAAAVDGAAPEEKPSFVSRFFKQLRSAMGAAMIGLAVALGQPPEEPFRDRTDGPCEVVPGEEIADDVTYIDFDDGESAMGDKG